jgi:peptide/nickel transport system substrate-binding protein/oligopeptide transport system substrate-binding protein
MLRRSRSLSWLVLGALALAPGGCGLSDQQDLKVLVIDNQTAPFATHGNLPLAGQLVRAATTEGLVALDDEGRISPALADRWIVTDDGQSYIFRLRDGTWPDGSAISGESVRTALHQALAGISHTPLALDLDGIDDIRAMAGRVVEIRLRRPVPDFLQLLAQPELGLSHHGQGNGPMALKRSGDTALLTAIPPDKRGLPAVAGWADNVRRVDLRAAAGADAVAAFAAGRADVVLGGTFVDLPRTNRSTLGRARPRFDPVSGLFGLVVTNETGLLADAALREAISMAIDRDTLAAAIALPMLITTTRMVAPGTIDDTGQIDERWLNMGLIDRRSEAGTRIRAWVEQHHQPATLRMGLPQGPGADLLFTRLAQDLAAVSVTVVRVPEGAPADLRLIDVVARYPRIGWFLDQLSCTADRLACSPAADEFVARARAASDPAASAGFYAQAEATLTQENVYIPIGVPIRWSLVAGDGAGFAINRWGQHALIALATGDH